MGLAYDRGTLYVMHAPYLTALRDTNGDGVADERRDLLSGLGLPPEENPVRLHCANGVTIGQSIMPEGLEKRLTETEFVNLIAYLASLK